MNVDSDWYGNSLHYEKNVIAIFFSLTIQTLFLANNFFSEYKHSIVRYKLIIWSLYLMILIFPPPQLFINLAALFLFSATE